MFIILAEKMSTTILMWINEMRISNWNWVTITQYLTTRLTNLELNFFKVKLDDYFSFLMYFFQNGRSKLGKYWKQSSLKSNLRSFPSFFGLFNGYFHFIFELIWNINPFLGFKYNAKRVCMYKIHSNIPRNKGE